jgi:hypothetical protein
MVFVVLSGNTGTKLITDLRLMSKLTAILAMLTFMFSCQKNINLPSSDNMNVTSEFVLNNSIILAEKDCAGDPATKTYICFESVSGDSRCPEGGECIWAGNAKVKFSFVRNGDNPLFFDLNTNTSFTNDTIVGGYKFTLKALNPYPSLKDINLPKSYKAEIEIEKGSN